MSIKYAILGLLSWKPSTGYELKKIFEESSSMYWSGNNNQIYKALLQLKDEGLVTSETDHQEGLPSKKIYTITKEGLSELKDWVISPADAPEFRKPFLIQLAWAEILSDEELFELLTKYENEVNIQILLKREKIRRGSISPRRSEREAFLWDMIDENILSSYQNELEWIKKLKGRLFEYELKEKREKMDYKIIESDDQKLKYIELLSCSKPLSSDQDVLELVGLCIENKTNLLMLHCQTISEDFFKLKTGVAGDILQKFTNYHVKVAAIIPNEKINTGKFKNMVIESNKGDQFGVFAERVEAEKWLVKI